MPAVAEQPPETESGSLFSTPSWPQLGELQLHPGRPLKQLTGWWYTYPSEKYESQLGLLFPIYGKIKVMFQTTNQLRSGF